jgi:hypothetical protein
VNARDQANWQPNDHVNTTWLPQIIESSTLRTTPGPWYWRSLGTGGRLSTGTRALVLEEPWCWRAPKCWKEPWYYYFLLLGDLLELLLGDLVVVLLGDLVLLLGDLVLLGGDDSVLLLGDLVRLAAGRLGAAAGRLGAAAGRLGAALELTVVLTSLV